MPKNFRRKGSYKKKTYRKKKAYKPKLSTKAISKRITRLEKEVETKYIINASNLGADTIYANWGSVTTPSSHTGISAPFLLNGTIRGITDTGQHLGSDIHMSNLRLRLNITGNPHQSGAIRVIVFKHKCPNGQLPVMYPGTSVQTFFADNAPLITSQYDTVTSDFSNAFKVLYDKTHHLQGWGTSLITDVNNTAGYFDAAPTKYLNLKIPLNCKVSYELGNAGTYADISRNAIYLCCITDLTPDKGNDGSSWYPFVIGTHKIGFKDA